MMGFLAMNECECGELKEHYEALCEKCRREIREEMADREFHAMREGA